MKRIGIGTFIILITIQAIGQAPALTVEKIMRDPKWMGTSPSNPQWSADGNSLFFNWNPAKAPADSFYYITREDHKPVKATVQQRQNILWETDMSYNEARTAVTYSRSGDIFYKELKTGKTKRITQTTDNEFSPKFSFNDSRIVYARGQNLYAWDLLSGETIQLTNIKNEAAVVTGNTGGGGGFGGGGFGGRGGGAGAGGAGGGAAGGSQQENWLKNDQLQYFQVLKERKQKREATEAYNKNLPKEKELKTIAIGDLNLNGITISPDGRFVNYRLFRSATGGKSTIVPAYVTESGFTTDINGRTKVGAPQSSSEIFVYDRIKDTVYAFPADSLPGIQDQPDYMADYPKPTEKRRPFRRAVSFVSLTWSPKGSNAVVEIRSQDNKDRWLMLMDTATGKLNLLDRQRDEAWVGGPGTAGFGQGNTGWINDNLFWYRSEVTGYSHLYTFNTASKEKKALTSGNYEVQQADLSLDKKYFYLTTNEVHPGEQQFYRLSIADGKKERITNMTGACQVSISPDEKQIAILYSYSNKPWELYLQENKPGGRIEQITNLSMSDEFKSYPWRDPELIHFTASDGAEVYARVYKPAKADPARPAVLFVHGAGYLQNAHKWWSSYFREYMFNNLLADNGYYVMDIDYRGSAGYGRDWRTGIYRHMGGKDLSDNVDAVNYLVKTYNVDPTHVGLYGGSYGGFITLMGLFTAPDVFRSGAALRPVTDWANYNHGYTANILNEPFNDSLAYRRSSPYYFADGLKGDLLICHGMVDVNVHYQDAVKLTQRLIELGKNNWELASYPMEDHGFVEPSSWTDEYKRIFKLFERTLK